MQANSIQLVGHCKYNVIMFNRQGALHQVIDPECLFGSLTFRAMPVATTVIAIANRATVIAYLFMSPKRGSPAI